MVGPPRPPVGELCLHTHDEHCGQHLVWCGCRHPLSLLAHGLLWAAVGRAVVLAVALHLRIHCKHCGCDSTAVKHTASYGYRRPCCCRYCIVT